MKKSCPIHGTEKIVKITVKISGNMTSRLRDSKRRCNFNERAGARVSSGRATGAEAVSAFEFGPSPEASVARKMDVALYLKFVPKIMQHAAGCLKAESVPAMHLPDPRAPDGLSQNATQPQLSNELRE